MKKVLIAVLALMIIGAAVAVYLFNKPHRNFSAEEPAFSLPADEFAIIYVGNSQEADSMYLDKVVLLKGILIQKQEAGMILDPLIYVALQDPTALEGKSEGDEVYIKGRVLGYDTLMDEIKIDNATFISPEEYDMRL